MTRNLPGEMPDAITLNRVSCETELNIVQEGVPGAIPARRATSAARVADSLSKLVEADIQINAPVSMRVP